MSHLKILELIFTQSTSEKYKLVIHVDAHSFFALVKKFPQGPAALKKKIG